MFDNTYKGKKVLITGNTGFKGSWLTCWLLDLGAQVFGISNGVPSTPSMFKELELEEKITHFDQDIRDLNKVKEIISTVKPDFIFHLAAQAIVSTSYKDPVETFSTNVMGTVNILESVRECHPNVVLIMITSDKCYDNVEWKWGYRENDQLGGKDIYSGSKGAAELAIKSYFHSFLKNGPTKVASVRAGNVIGGGDWASDRLVPDCFRAWQSNKPVSIRSPEATRPWQHVLEPLSGYLTVGQNLSHANTNSGESYNFGPQNDYNCSVIELLENLFKISNIKMNGKAFDLSKTESFHEARLLKLNCDKALFDLKWKPTLNYHKTIKFIGDWYREYYSSNKTDLFNLTMDQIHQYISYAKDQEINWSLK